MKTPQFQPQPNEGKSSFINGNKGLIIAVILVAIALVIVFRTFLGSDSAKNYEGIIKKVETETAQRSLDNS